MKNVSQVKAFVITVKMKLTLVFVLVAFGYFVSADIDEQIIAHSNDCMKETGVAMDLVTKLKNHDLSSEDPKLKVKTNFWGFHFEP